MDWGIVGPAVLLIATGGGIAALAGAVGAVYQSRGEHLRWLREVRMKRFEAFANAANAYVVAAVHGQQGAEQVLNLQAAENTLALIGPEHVYGQAKAVLDYALMVADNPKALPAYTDAAAAFNAEARSVLKIPDRQRFSILRP